MEIIGKQPVVYWKKKVPDTNLEKLKKIIEKNHKVKFGSYWELHKWSIENYAKFIEEVWHFLHIIASKGYKEVWVKTGPGFLDNEWFSGARLNYAENMLRRRDETIAVNYLDELGNKESVTYSQLYEEVKKYAGAFKKNGLKKGDTVACFMSNRKEAIIAMLAAASIGALWGGAVPFYGLKIASNIISTMEPKFLITIDTYQDNYTVFPILSYLPEIVKNTPTLEKVILVVTEEETRKKKDLQKIRNCVFLETFLQDALDSVGNVPDLVFEQLPFDYPLCINFTSGTTGLPKANIHSIGSMMIAMQHHSLSLNLKKGDVVCMNFPVGWILWDMQVPCLSLGLTLFIYSGSPYVTINGKSFWDNLSEHRCNALCLITSTADRMEKLNVVPSKGTDMSCLKVVGISGNPVKRHNIEYIKNKVNKNVFVANDYGSTETFGVASGFDMNMPVYGTEMQVPSLGIDLQCFNSEGKSVVGEIGDSVICNPVYHLPTHLWKDVNRTRLIEIYMKRSPGVWYMQDDCWINPKTKGMVVIGRSDDTLKQNSERYSAADVYIAIHPLEEIEDFICVSQRKFNGNSRSVLFVKMRSGKTLTPEIKKKIENDIIEELWEECVPELILEIPDIPYNVTSKRMESLVRQIIAKNEIPEVMNIRNPECLKHFINIPEILSYNQH